MENGYYLGIDCGTNSVGYAVTSKTYELLKYRGEPMWGVTTFEEAALAKDWRMHRTTRRRLDRRQQRVKLLSELFAPSICAIDPYFFIRRRESALFAEDTQHGVKLFEGGITDKEYHKAYPTIHHLILDLMTTDSPRDVRLVYLACAWLVANRGHFLLDVDADNAKNFSIPYSEFEAYFIQDCGCDMPWSSDVQPDAILRIMQTQAGVKKKTEMFTELVYGGKAPSKKPDAAFPFSRSSIVSLLCGGKVNGKDLFANEAFSEIGSFSLTMDADGFEQIAASFGEDGDLLRILRKLV